MNALAVRLDNSASKEDFDQFLATNPKITRSGSRFNEDIWDLSEEMSAARKPPSEKRLEFRMRVEAGYVAKHCFPNGKCLIDFPVFHRHAKQLLAAMIWCPRNKSGPVFSGKSLINTAGVLRKIYTYLARQGIDDLASVPSWEFESFVNQTKTFSSSFSATFRLVFLYRDLAPGFSFNPYSVVIENPAALEGSRIRFDRQTAPIPDTTFRQLLGVCRSYVDERADAILAARDLLENVRKKRCGFNVFATRYPTKSCTRLHREIWDQIDLRTISPGNCDRLTELERATTIIDACRNLQVACVTLLFAITGVRLNEGSTLRNGCIKRTRDGRITRIWIKSVHMKYADAATGDVQTWLCGPVGEKVVSILTRLSEPTRRESNSDYIIGPLAESGRHRIRGSRAYKGGSASRFFSSKGWWAHFLREHGILGQDGEIAQIRAHQFRRTFARWCALSDSETCLLALKDHFKHASFLMSRHYARIDDELMLLFEQERNRLGAESFDKVLRSESLGGAGGRSIKRRLDQAIESGDLPREFRGAAGARFRARAIQEWLQSGVQMRACGGHFCVPIDPHFTCTDTTSMGCNKGACPNAVFHPDHSPGLAQKIRNDRRTLERINAWTPHSPYAKELSKNIRIQEKILRDIT
jgi:hypothetical protein